MEREICKAVGSEGITDDQLEGINRYTRRTLGRDEVFVFSVILCDNAVDRELERFSAESLKTLGELFLGSTGVFDHAPKAENQSARIFATTLEEGGEGGDSGGEPYCALKAWAYMVRCEKNADLILEIDAGIKKEVSVGCAVAKILCSVCGADQREGGCAHQKGVEYEGKPCHHLLAEPTDAYEWSFVAVPAQKRAGVTKRMRAAPREDTVAVAKARLDKLEKLAAAGERYESLLRREVVRLGLLSGQDLTANTLEGIVARLDGEQLEALRKSYGAAARQRYPIPLRPQLGPGKEPDTNETDRSFQI